MTTPIGPDLSLPSKSPTQSYKNESHNCDTLAVYTLVALQDHAEDLTEALQNDDENLRRAYGLPSKYSFVGESLKNIYDYHLKLKEKYHPTLFIVAQHTNYRKHGVLLVNLNTDLACSVDICRMKCNEALSAGVSLKIGNMDWEDLKEDELPPHTVEADQERDSTRPDQHLASPFIFGAYGIAEGANMTTARGLLEPDWLDKQPHAILCEAVCSYTKYPEPLKEVIKRHPWNCRRNPRLHRNWCICVDGPEPEKDGVLVVRINWSGNIEIEPNELLKVTTEDDFTSERSSVSEALTILATRAAED